MARIFLITGYRGMGKDYLARHGLDNYVLLKHHKSQAKCDYHPDKFNLMKFATPLRKLLNGYFTPDVISPHSFEQRKDDITYLNYEGSLRTFFIEIARATRRVDQDFFAKRLDMEIEDENVVVTDWRYPNEYEYLKRHNDVTTIRVYREYDHHGRLMNLPSIEDDSERSLDSFKTDFIAIPHKYYNDNYTGLIKKFPWVIKYKQIN